MTTQDQPENKKHVIIFTDGGCDPNPGKGGYGAVLLFGEARKETSGGFRLTTNNRMEILAAIKGLELLREPCKVTLNSDSQYLVNAISKGWVTRWQKKNWWRTPKERALNIDLWQRLLPLCETHQVDFVWVRGHAGNAENERCDELSSAALRQMDLPVDEGYENKSPDEEQIKITQPGQPCSKCATPVIKRVSWKRPKREIYYEYFLYCPTCHTAYSTKEAKRHIEDEPSIFGYRPEAKQGD